jgi:spermidine synthase
MKKLAFSLLLLSVFAAGAASLLYEVLWVRLLGLSLGSTALASSVMLSAFLGGLALGSWYMGRRSDVLESPLKVLFGVELAAAAVGALSIPALSGAGRAYVLIATAAGGSFTSLLLRAVFSLIVMLIPATIFGATFPLTTAAAARMTSVEFAAGGVSAASCFGSAVGAAVCGLLLEPALGLSGSAFVGAGINIAAALLAIVAAQLILTGEPAPAKAAPAKKNGKRNVAKAAR